MLAAAAACGDDPPAPAPQLDRAFRLVTVGGSAVPLEPCCGFFCDCKAIQSGRIEPMSRGRVRDILDWKKGPEPWQYYSDTVISAYRLPDRMLILQRSVFGNSGMNNYADTARFDGAGRLEMIPHFLGFEANSRHFLYVPE